MKQSFRGYLFIALVGILMATGVTIKYRQDIDWARANYVNEEHYKSQDLVKEIEVVFRTIYQGLRIITGLPDVRRIDRHAHNFDRNERQAVQEIYKSIAGIISLSEIYIVPADFDPLKFDEVTGRMQEPIVMFDNLITGKTALSNKIADGTLKNAEHNVNEVEIFEYKLLVQQLGWLKEHFNFEHDINEAGGSVAVTGSEVLTCDNSRFDPLHPDNQERSGLVYSLPFYDLRGQLKGVVSGIFLSSVLREHLPSGKYVLGSRKYGYVVRRKNSNELSASQSWIDRIESDPELIYSEVLPVDIIDTENTWYLWAGSPNAAFYNRSDVIVAGQFALLGYFGCFILTLIMCAGFFFFRRHNLHLQMMNKELLAHQALVERSRDRIKKFSGKILSVREEEMKRLGRDLHDMVGSMAVSLSAKLTVTEGKIRDRNIDGALDNLKQTKKLLEAIIGSFKKIAVSLRPPQLETVGLSGALKEYCIETAKMADLPVKLDIDIDNDLKIPEDLAIALFRVVQESLTNVIKHAHAQYFSVSMQEQSGSIVLVIWDDGKGFNSRDSEQYPQKLKMGILGMRERIESFGGEFLIESQYGKGTRIRISVPLKGSLV